MRRLKIFQYLKYKILLKLKSKQVSLKQLSEATVLNTLSITRLYSVGDRRITEHGALVE
jgi:hypothetical protein